jgi:membrane protein DedA with SNARE-associated domain
LSEAPDARRKLLLWCLVPLGIMSVGSLIGTAFMPYLLARRPIVLIALSPLFRHLVLAAPRLDVVSFFAVAVPRHFMPDPFMYLLGREYGHLAVEWAESNSPVTGRFVRAMERAFAKIGPIALLVSPDIIVSTLAGAAKVPVPLFVVFNILGTIGTAFVARWFGAAFSEGIASVVRFFEAHLLMVTAVSVLLVVLFNWYFRRQPVENAETVEKGDGTAEP